MTTIDQDWLVSADLTPDVADPRLAPFYAAASNGELALPVCAGCGLALELEQRVCDGCDGGEVRWVPTELTGTVHAVTTVHRREAGLIVAEQPYPVIDVELASGHRLVITTTAPCAASPAIGDPVQIAFRSVGGVAIPAVYLAEAPQPTLEVSS
jgi:uncharacterized OB-fold protein